MIYIIGWTCLNWVIYQWWSLIINLLKYDLSRLMCPKCFSFWLTLILTYNPFLAAIVSFNMYIIDLYLINKKIEL